MEHLETTFDWFWNKLSNILQIICKVFERIWNNLWNHWTTCNDWGTIWYNFEMMWKDWKYKTNLNNIIKLWILLVQQFLKQVQNHILSAIPNTEIIWYIHDDIYHLTAEFYSSTAELSSCAEQPGCLHQEHSKNIEIM